MRPTGPPPAMTTGICFFGVGAVAVDSVLMRAGSDVFECSRELMTFE